ncbi:MAG: hypothetical protein ABIG89_04095 [Candidatus Woesearchaeota archaeon]
MVQIVITLIGLITVLAGILPFVGSFIGLPTQAISGIGYSIMIILIGALGLLYGFMSMSLIGGTKFVMVCLGLLTMLGGIIPFLTNVLPISIPTTGPLYSGIIMIIGVLGFVYGLNQF